MRKGTQTAGDQRHRPEPCPCLAGRVRTRRVLLVRLAGARGLKPVISACKWHLHACSCALTGLQHREWLSWKFYWGECRCQMRRSFESPSKETKLSLTTVGWSSHQMIILSCWLLSSLFYISSLLSLLLLCWPSAVFLLRLWEVMVGFSSTSAPLLWDYGSSQRAPQEMHRQQTPGLRQNPRQVVNRIIDRSLKVQDGAGHPF